MYQKIGDYGIIGNFRTAALVSHNGSIDWLCLPHFDSPSVFAALLDDARGGRFAVHPEEEFDATASYLPGTNVLSTTFRTRHGMLRVTDFMPVSGEAVSESAPSGIYRLAETLEGEVSVRAQFHPRFDYARGETVMEGGGSAVAAHLDERRLLLRSTRGGLRVKDGRAVGLWQLSAGQRLWLHLVFGEDSREDLRDSEAAAALRDTESFWHGWLDKRETGQDLDFGPFKEMIERSSLVLKLLDFSPSGAIVAAPTTSLPEEIGGERNWDYRFTWIRDSALTVEALFNIGHLSELEKYLHWLEESVCAKGTGLQVLYGLRGETELAEAELSHLEGYKGSRPVRIGNDAFRQRQLDIYGEVMEAALRLSSYVGKIGFAMWPFLRAICETVVESWREKDAGIWEVRGGPYHFVYSKVMCWTALDRGLTIAHRYGFPADRQRWESVREEIRQEVLEKGWNEKKRAFVQHFDTDALDASNLLIPFYGFLPYDDPRMVSTVAAIEQELLEEGFVYRYRTSDGLSGKEGTFLLCSFWLVDNLIGQGRLEEAQILLLRLEKTANALGLFSEEYDPVWREALGNFPQAFTHIGYINSVFALCRARRTRTLPHPVKPLGETLRQKLLVAQRFLLNEGPTPGEGRGGDIAKDLKHLMNLLRGAFFNPSEGRVAYEEMATSKVYRNYLECSRHLQRFDLERLVSRDDRMAFWINLFNVLVIHGVIELGIRDSVKGIPRFFRRIAYRIGGMEFTADDIEHGILRGNHRFPNSLFHPFDTEDPRRKHMIRPVDPRIHFALVCASSSCPPIEIYRAETLEEDLTVSGKTFLNSGGVRIEREEGTVWLPQVFHWYGEDFGASDEERLRFVAPFLYDEADRRFLEERATTLRVNYQPYDWRLNRI
jgi:GH15 family glucan-1,4-alpha-glucosidase